MTAPLFIERHGDVAHVVLHRPDKHNALNYDLLRALESTAKELKADRQLRAVILRGEGKSFCSGLDFPHFQRRPMDLPKIFISKAASGQNLVQRACALWRDLPVPVIAVLHGSCFGGGAQLALAADFRLATPGLRFSIMEAKWGLIPDMSASLTLRELLPIDQAKLLTMTGRQISAEEALRLHLITEVRQDALGAATDLAAELQTRSPDAVAATKELFQTTWVARARQALQVERRLQAKILLGGNQRKAMRANGKSAPKVTRFSPRSWFF